MERDDEDDFIGILIGAHHEENDAYHEDNDGIPQEEELPCDEGLPAEEFEERSYSDVTIEIEFGELYLEETSLEYTQTSGFFLESEIDDFKKC